MSHCVERQRRYCFTVNNYTEQDVNEIRSWEKSVKYLIFGYEIAPTTGTAHLQGYVHFINARSFSSMKNKIPNIHLEVAKGNDQQNKEYCSKGNYFEEYGTPQKQGKRSDIDMVRDAVKDGATLKDLYEVVSSYQASKFAENYYNVYHSEKRTEPPTVIWLYGSTGCGKTKWAFDHYPDLCNISYNNGFFQGLPTKHETVLIDDFRKDFCKFHYLLRLLDRYPMTVNIKGKELNWRPKVVIITSPYSPEETYSTREDIKQLTRRITHCVNMDENKYFVNV